MFRSLLNTLPIFSGNHTIACKVNDIYKQSDKNYYVYIHQAELKPLNIYHTLPSTINLNLNNGKYAFDVKRYASLTNIFSDNYIFEPFTFKTLDKINYISDRNKTFEFGCQRISYQYNKFEWSFYAPIYINRIEDIPDYFVIEIKTKNTHKLLKQIKIAIGKRFYTNNLYYYIKNHIEDIQNNIPIIWHYNNNEIVLNNIIDCSTGAIVTKVVPALNQILYYNHVTINEFDSMLSYLYYYNNSIISEVIPLSFEFNLKDFLSDSDIKFYDFNSYIVSGYYETASTKNQFYMFDVNSHNNTAKITKFDSKEEILYTEKYNVYNVNRIETFHESTNSKLRHTNTINKTYCKWNNYDDVDYIINNNLAYSSNITNKYGEYPIYKTNVTALKLLITYYNESLNAILPVSNKSDMYSASSTAIYETLLNNHISTWFTIFDNESLTNHNNWTDVNSFNHTCICNGLMYHNLPEDIQKFNVFLKLNYLDTSILTFGNILYNNDTINIKDYTNTYDVYNTTEDVLNNTYLSEVKSADDVSYDNDYYILYKNVSNEEYILYDTDSKNNLPENVRTLFDECISYKLINKITDYVYLNQVSVNNVAKIWSKYFDSNRDVNVYYLDVINNGFVNISDIYAQYKLEDMNILVQLFKNTELIYIPRRDQLVNIIKDRIETLNGVVDLSFITINNNQITNISDKLSRLNVIIDGVVDDNYNTMLQQIKCALKLYNQLATPIKNIKGENIQKYHYIIDNNRNNVLINYFIPYDNLTSDVNDVYIDPFNLDEFCRINNINLTFTNAQRSSLFKDVYCPFINKEHLKEYCEQLYATNIPYNNNQTQISPEEIFNNIYVRQDILDNNDLHTKVYVAKLSSFMDYYFKDMNTGVADTDIKESPIEYFLNNTTYDEANDEFTIYFNNFQQIDNVDICVQKKYTCKLMFRKQLIKLNKNILQKFDPTLQDHKYSKYLYYYISVNKINFDNNAISPKSILNQELPESQQTDFNPETEHYQEINYNANDILVHPIFSSVYISDTFINDNINFLNKLNFNGLNCEYIPENYDISVYQKITVDDAKTFISNNQTTVYKVESNFNHANIDYEDDSVIHTIEWDDGIKGAYILINQYLSNNTLSYNIENDIYNNMDISYVNDSPISEYMFTLLYPFLKNDIFYDILHDLYDYIVLPTNIKLLQKYKNTYSHDKKETNLIYNTSKQYIYLNRYFYNIMPSLVPIENILPDIYAEVYKTDECVINNSNNDYISYILDENCNIYKAHGINYITNVKELPGNLHTYDIPENKHFTASELYHLPINLIVNTHSSVIDAQLADFEDKTTVYKYFENYVKNNFYNKIDNESLLFLFNKYTYNITKNVINYNISLNVKLYEVVYIFTLK